MTPSRPPWWRQATALVSISTGGAITGLSFAPGTPADLTSPTNVPVHLLALRKTSQPAPKSDAALRAAVVNVANYYLRMAETTSPAEMEAIIWRGDSTDGADRGESCAAFASLTLELAAQAVGRQSWVTGGTTYPWPLHQWADVRVDPNPDSLGIVSVLQDAQAHHRWHPLGDGYQPQPGDWVLFDGHVEVVTRYTGGVLYTIGGDSLPNFSVNAHQYADPLASQGVAGFVNNGDLATTAAQTGKPDGVAQASAGRSGRGRAQPGQAAIPGAGPAPATAPASGRPAPGTATIPGAPLADQPAGHRAAAPGTGTGYGRHQPPAASESVPQTSAQQAFINEVAPGAVAAQHRHGVPAAVTIAQAIDESGWGQSVLATRDHNLFGIKGTGPAGSDVLPTQEYENGQWVTVTAPFRVYHNVAESVADHAELLATSGYYQQAMADRAVPDAFANDLTGIYATDPQYGANLISLMRLYDLYRYDSGTPTAAPAATPGVPAAHAPPAAETVFARRVTAAVGQRPAAGARRDFRASAVWYQELLPRSVMTAFITTAKAPLMHGEPLYQDASARRGIRWELLAACDWMQCKAHPRVSPVYGERLGTVNPDGTVYRTKSEALARCATDLVQLAARVYQIDLVAHQDLSVPDLASAFAAFRWGGLLRRHDISAMDFPYSVAGLTVRHLKMRWPQIDGQGTPDKPGARFRMPFGAVPLILGLHYPAII